MADVALVRLALLTDLTATYVDLRVQRGGTFDREGNLASFHKTLNLTEEMRETGVASKQLHAALEGQLVGVGALEGGQERVVDVDGLARHPLAHVVGKHPYVAGENDKLGQTRNRIDLDQVLSDVDAGNGRGLGGCADGTYPPCADFSSPA